MSLVHPVPLQDLKVALRAISPSRAAPSLPLRRLETGITAVDRVLGGGLALGKVTVWSGAAGAGLSSLLRLSVARCLNAQHRIAIVDGFRTFHPLDWVGLGDARSLWFLRPPEPVHLVWAAEALARSGAFTWVVLDLGSRVHEVRRWAAHLKRAAREGGSALLMLTTAGEGIAGSAVMRVTPKSFDFETCRRTLTLSLVRGGFPLSAEVVLDASSQIIPRRLPLDPRVPDRRPRARRDPREGFAHRAGPR